MPWVAISPAVNAGLQCAEPSRAQPCRLPSKMRSTSCASFLIRSLGENTAATASTTISANGSQPWAPIALLAMAATQNVTPSLQFLSGGMLPSGMLGSVESDASGLGMRGRPSKRTADGTAHAKRREPRQMRNRRFTGRRSTRRLPRCRTIEPLPQCPALPWAYEKPELDQLGPDSGHTSSIADLSLENSSAPVKE